MMAEVGICFKPFLAFWKKVMATQGIKREQGGSSVWGRSMARSSPSGPLAGKCSEPPILLEIPHCHKSRSLLPRPDGWDTGAGDTSQPSAQTTGRWHLSGRLITVPCLAKAPPREALRQAGGLPLGPETEKW